MFDNVRRVFGHSIVYGSADVAIQAVNFLLLPIYTRVLTPAEYGALAVLLVFEAFLKQLHRFGLGTSFVRFYYDYDDPSARKTLAGTVLLMLAALNAALLVILLLAAPALTSLALGSGEHTLAFVLLILNGTVTSVFVVPFGLLRIQERPTRLASLTFGRSLGTVLMRLALVVGLRLGVVGIMLADVIVTAVMLAVLYNLTRPAVAWRFSRKMADDALRFAAPQVPYGLLHQTMAMSDRFFLAMYLPLEQVGVYLIGTSVASLIKLYPVAFKTAWMPFAFGRMDRPDAPKLFAKLATYAFGVLVFSTLGMAALAENLVTLMTPPEFFAAASVVPVLAFGMAIQTTTTFIGTSVEVSKRTHLYLVATSLAAVVSVLGHLLLIPRLGIMGAAISVGIGQTVMAASLGWLGQRHYPIPYEWSRLAKLMGLAFFVYGLTVSVSSGTGLVGLATRLGMLAAFPLGLFGLRFFRPEEIADLKRLALLGRTAVAAAPAAPPGSNGSVL